MREDALKERRGRVAEERRREEEARLEQLGLARSTNTSPGLAQLLRQEVKPGLLLSPDLGPPGSPASTLL